MSLRDDLDRQVRGLHSTGSTMPASLQVSDATGIVLRLELTQVDSMSCAFTELTLFVPQLQNKAFDVLKRWADALGQRVSYLLEKIELLEFDPATGQALIRSSPPQSATAGKQYYEILLSSTGNGTFTLKRYRTIAGQPGRDEAEIQVTLQVLLKLVDDLIATIPPTP